MEGSNPVLRSSSGPMGSMRPRHSAEVPRAMHLTPSTGLGGPRRGRVLGQEINSIAPGANYDTTWLLAHRLCWPGTLGHLPSQPHPDPRPCHPTQAGAPGSFSQDTDGRWPMWALRAPEPLPSCVRPFPRQDQEGGPCPSGFFLCDPLCSCWGPSTRGGHMQAGLLGHPPPGCPHLHPRNLSVPIYRATSTTPETTGHQPQGTPRHVSWACVGMRTGGTQLSPTGSSNRDTQGCRRGWVGGYVNT